MRVIDSPSKITGFSVTDLELKMGGAGSLTMKSSIVFQDKNGAVHARSEYVGPWSQQTLERVADLLQSLENDLTSIHFGVEEEDGRAARGEESPREPRAPIGIIGSRLDSPGDKAPQF